MTENWEVWRKIRALTLPPGFAGKVDPDSEDALSMQVAAALHEWAITGRMFSTWTKIPHEVGAVARNNSQFGKAQARYAKQRAMGLVSGSCDFVFVWKGGGGWIELKRPKSGLSPNQADFRDWCRFLGINHAICRSLAEVETTLVNWGVLSLVKAD